MSFNRKFAKGAEHSLPCIFAVKGLSLSDGEASLFEQANPFGFILFKRNCDNPEQVKALVLDLKERVGRDCPILIDQEGGRVARLRSPHWNEYKPMRFYGEMYERDGVDAAKDCLREDMIRLAGELTALGINVDCAPVLDLLFEDAHEIIGDRSFGSDIGMVAELGTVVCEAFLEAGVMPVIKHIPGHGRALSDSHKSLPHVAGVKRSMLAINDFAPFSILSKGALGQNIWAMTAHMTYEALKVDEPVSLSASVIDKVIRRQIGFDGVLLCDDLDMKALDAYGSTISKKAVKALYAGCDVALYCAGELDKMEELAAHLPKMSDEALRRLGHGA